MIIEYIDFYLNLLSEAKYLSKYNNINVRRRDNCYDVTDPSTGGESHACIMPRKNAMGDEIGKIFTIISWDATPLRLRQNPEMEKEYIGGGFARNCMAKFFEITKQENIDYLGIFSPSDDSNRVMNSYVSKHILNPIPDTLHITDDNQQYHTQFRINRNKADQYVDYVKSM
jgi:hypothetical protein